MAKKQDKIKQRLEYLRGELRAERISTGEIVELQDLIPHIDPSDIELLEAAGVPEDPTERDIALAKQMLEDEVFEVGRGAAIQCGSSGAKVIKKALALLAKQEDGPFDCKVVLRGEFVGEPGMKTTSRDLLQEAQNMLENNETTEIMGTNLFQTEDGTFYKIVVEALIVPVSKDEAEQMQP